MIKKRVFIKKKLQHRCSPVDIVFSAFFEGWSWFKFNNLGLGLGTNLKFYTSVAKGLKLKVGNFRGLILTFVEITGEKLLEGAFLHSILNRVNGS